jgi:aryl carrier-like protein
MSNLIDSVAVFEQRALQCGLTVAERDALVAAQSDTLAKYAFSCNYAPGAADERPFITMVTVVLGQAPDAVQAGSFRRLFFEAYTLAAADLRQRVDRVEDSQPRKLAAPERAFRYQSQVARLGGLNLVNELEPSDALVDRACQMFEDNRLVYLDWELCTKKSQELRGIKKIPVVQPHASGQIRWTNQEQLLEANLDSELLIRFALQRRGLALDQASLITFGTHDAWVDHLFFHRMAVPPANYAKVSLEQLINADKALHAKMATLTRAGIVPTALGLRPLDAALTASMAHASVTFLLMPLPLTSATNANKRIAADEDAADGSKGKGKGKAKKAKAAEKAGDKGKSKGKGSKDGAPRNGMPADLAGMSARDAANNLICFNFNRACGCSNAVSSNKCSRGMHVCCKPGCGGSHSLTVCPTN